MSVIKYENIQWSVPTLFYDDAFALAYADILENLNIPNPIKYVYGMVSSRWSGGRNATIKLQDKENIIKVIKELTKRKMTPAFTFSNKIINEEVLQDEYCNWLLDVGVENNCQFIIVSDKLFYHIKKRYPEAKCVSSVIQPMAMPALAKDVQKEIDFYNERLDRYDRVVVRPDFSIDLLEYKDKISDLSRIEVLVNQTCRKNCPGYCYSVISKCESGNNNIEAKIRCAVDMYTNKHGIADFCRTQSIMHSEELIRNLMDIGVIDFKVQGRHYNKTYCRQVINDHLLKDMGTSFLVKNKITDYANKLEMTDFLYSKEFIDKNLVLLYRKTNI